MKTYEMWNQTSRVRSATQPDDFVLSEHPRYLDRFAQQDLTVWLRVDSARPAPSDPGTKKVVAAMPVFNGQASPEPTVTYGWMEVNMSLQEIAAWELTQGFTLDPEGWVIGCTRQDIDNWNLMLTRVENKVNTGQLLVLTGKVDFKDRSGTWREVSVQRFRQMVDAAGDYYLERWVILNS